VIEYKYYAANVGLLKTEMITGGNELEVLTSVEHQQICPAIAGMFTII
jgi:hypothetical protein